MDQSPEPPPASVPAGRWRLPRLPRLPLLVGAIGLGAMVTVGTTVTRRAEARQQAEARAIRMELAALQDEVGHYAARIRTVRWQAEKLAEAAGGEPTAAAKTWARERARLFATFVAKLDRSAEENRFTALAREIGEACAKGEIGAARDRLVRLPAVKFPAPAEVARLRDEAYVRPLAELSRRSPGSYRAFQQAEPEAAAEDMAKLRVELAGADRETVTPQAMMQFELLSAVAPAGDPVVADWAALVSAEDYFEQPDAAVLAHWRRAQQALRGQDWAGAAAQMQAITRTTVRTRQPFRAAYGKAILKNRPDQTASAYPFMEEAAKAGDAAARAWVAQEDLAQKRYARALAWYEAARAEEEVAAVEPLVALYAMKREILPRDSAREARELRRIVTLPDAPPLASMLLARLYEQGEGVAASAAQALASYQRAAEQRHAPALVEVARCWLRGLGTAADAEQAGVWACRAYVAGEREPAVAILLELLRTAPERVATGVQEMIEHETTAAPAGFNDTRTGAADLAKLKMELARYFDRKGNFAQAAKLYAQSGSRDPAVVSRRAELTTAHPCDSCGGSGKIQSSTPCATCAGKATVLCHVCDGRGYSFVPGTPPCTTCGGSGQMEQDGRPAACATCGGTGKGKGSVIKKECTACSHGREPCRDCTGGRIKLLKECPDCRGSGARALADR